MGPATGAEGGRHQEAGELPQHAATAPGAGACRPRAPVRWWCELHAASPGAAADFFHSRGHAFTPMIRREMTR
jgi:hypothetical protein